MLDKASFGATEFGLVHSVHELLGGEATGKLLTQLGKLFTGYNQMHGFTCGIGDLLITPAANKVRLRRRVRLTLTLTRTLTLTLTLSLTLTLTPPPTRRAPPPSRAASLRAWRPP